jgi:hypothetical protein
MIGMTILIIILNTNPINPIAKPIAPKAKGTTIGPKNIMRATRII